MNFTENDIVRRSEERRATELLHTVPDLSRLTDDLSVKRTNTIRINENGSAKNFGSPIKPASSSDSNQDSFKLQKKATFIKEKVENKV